MANAVQINKYLYRIINNLQKNQSVKLKGQKVYSSQVLISAYEHSGYDLLWQNEQNRHDLLSIIEEAYLDGLNPYDYHVEYIRNNITKHRSKPSRSFNKAVADIIMTEAILTYRMHLAKGKVNQNSLKPNWQDCITTEADTLIQSLRTHLSNNTLKKWIDASRPKLKIYNEFKNLFAKYYSIYHRGGHLVKLKYPGFSLKLGDTIPEVELLKQHLVANAYSSLSVDNVFDQQLEEVVKDFQILNGIDSDGIVGEKTYEALNISIPERLDILRVNMDRIRWLNHKLPDDYILINIASFYLHVVKSNKMTYYCRVVVGKDHKQTPTFSSQISYLVFNPSWRIPFSIVSEEILPQLKSDKKFLQDRNMVLWKGNKQINPETTDFSQYSIDYFPFSITQQPGPSNALGKVKFIFSNPYAVYLHDTPSKSLFNRSERAFSHGCIRVENPLQLAHLLLNDQKYSLEQINEIVATKETTTVFLNKQMPVVIIYMTCDDNKHDGRISFYKDIYGLDQQVLDALSKSR